MGREQHGEQPLGLYLSVPFCRSKCTFCNFASGVYPAGELPRYVDRLVSDLQTACATALQQGLLLPGAVDTVYFGGGTPSLLSPVQLTELFRAIRAHFDVLRTAEITLEAAPGFLQEDLLAAAAEAGVTRISFGVQTFVDSEARATGRLHTAAQALGDIAAVQRAGMAASVDLIAGLPGQTAASWQHSLAVLTAAAPEHASIYMLEVDEASRLGGEMLLGGTRYGAALTPSDDAVADFYTEACLVLAGSGLEQYEISNFARPGHASRHNLRYGRREPYLGLGVDAHSMLRAVDGRAVRFGTGDLLEEYLAGHDAASQPVHRLTQEEELEEAWFLGLRCNSGVSLLNLRQEFGEAAVQPFLPLLQSLGADGLVTLADGTARLTERGRLLANSVFLGFLGMGVAEEAPAMAAPAR